MSEKVQIYGWSTCPYTNAAREDFGARGVEVEYFDVQRDAEAMKRFLQLSGGDRRVPLLVERGRVTTGFRGT